MKYQNGPLQIVRPETDFLFSIEIGQGATTPVLSSADLKQGVDQLLKDASKPDAFIQALNELRSLGESTDWDWDKILRHSESHS